MYNHKFFSTWDYCPHTIIRDITQWIFGFWVKDRWKGDEGFKKLVQNTAVTLMTVAPGFRASATCLASS